MLRCCQFESGFAPLSKEMPDRYYVEESQGRDCRGLGCSTSFERFEYQPNAPDVHGHKCRTCRSRR